MRYNAIEHSINERSLIAPLRSILSRADSFDYIILFARRCFNLFYAWNERLSFIKRGESHKFLTETGLLSYISIIAKRYVLTHELPRVLFVDDVLIHGYTINNKVSNYVESLEQEVEYLWKQTHLNTLNMRKLHREIIDSISLVVFAQNNDQLLIDPELKWNLDAYRLLNTEDWHRYSRKIRTFIKDGNVANTSYIVSMKVSEENDSLIRKDFLDKNGWVADSFKFELNSHQQESEMFFYNAFNGKLRNEHVHATVRRYRSGENIFYIPYLFHGELRLDDYIELFLQVENLAQEHNLKHFVSAARNALAFFSQEERSMITFELYAQFIEMFLSQMVLNLFVQDCVPVSMIPSIDYDYKKIAHNFGEFIKAEDIYQLCMETWLGQELLYISEIFKRPIMKGVPEYAREKPSDQRAFEDMVDISYACGLNSCIFANKMNKIGYREIRDNSSLGYSEQKKRWSDHDPRDVPMLDILNTKDKDGNVITDVTYMGKLLASSAFLMDEGYLALRISVWGNNRHHIKSELCFRHTELTLSLYPMVFGRNWKTVRTAVDYCRMTGYSFREFLNLVIPIKNSWQERILDNIGKALDEERNLYAEICLWDEKDEVL